jgi:hypothetical protein
LYNTGENYWSIKNKTNVTKYLKGYIGFADFIDFVEKIDKKKIIKENVSTFLRLFPSNLET